jgi:hypothetical protein
MDQPYEKQFIGADETLYRLWHAPKACLVRFEHMSVSRYGREQFCEVEISLYICGMEAEIFSEHWPSTN